MTLRPINKKIKRGKYAVEYDGQTFEMPFKLEYNLKTKRLVGKVTDGEAEEMVAEADFGMFSVMGATKSNNLALKAFYVYPKLKASPDQHQALKGLGKRLLMDTLQFGLDNGIFTRNASITLFAGGAYASKYRGGNLMPLIDYYKAMGFEPVEGVLIEGSVPLTVERMGGLMMWGQVKSVIG